MCGTANAVSASMLMPAMDRYMTRQPWTIRKDAKMSQAHALMRAHRIRHLPVLEAGKLVGIVSDHDLHLIETLPDSDHASLAAVLRRLAVDPDAWSGAARTRRRITRPFTSSTTAR